jgi:hypothetical protein
MCRSIYCATERDLTNCKIILGNIGADAKVGALGGAVLDTDFVSAPVPELYTLS